MLKTQINRKGWCITIVGSLFFFYAIIQVNLLTALNHELLAFFKATETKIALLSSWGFYAHILMILPAGLLVDRFSIKNLMLVNLFISIIGTLIFAFANFLFIAAIGRFLCGIAMPFGFIACLKLASYWISEKEMTKASSIIFSIGMLGGVFSQIVLAFLRYIFGWKIAVIVVALIGFFIAFILFVIVKDKNTEEQLVIEETDRLSMFESLKIITKQKQNWLNGFFICFANLPISILGALFGISYLIRVYCLSDLISASIVSMLFCGVIIGSPIFGFISNKINRRKPPMVMGIIFGIILMLILLCVPHLPLVLLYLIFLGIGFASASQVIGFSVINESNQPKVVATAMSLAIFINSTIGYCISLPIVGKILDTYLSKQVMGLLKSKAKI